MIFHRLIFRIILILCLAVFLGSCLKTPQFDVMLMQSQLDVNEDDGKVSVEFVLPDGPRKREVEIAYRYGGTAKEGIDYTTREENYIFIPQGETSISFDIELIDNIDEDGPKTIIIAIILVVENGNTIFQGAERQSLTILIKDDDCSVYIGGEWNYFAEYYMYSEGDTTRVGQDNEELSEGENPQFEGVVNILDPENNRSYFIDDMLIGMFSGLDIETPCPIFDNCGTLSGPNDGSVLLMGTLPAYLSGNIEDDDTIIINFEYQNTDMTAGGYGNAILIRK